MRFARLAITLAFTTAWTVFASAQMAVWSDKGNEQPYCADTEMEINRALADGNIIHRVTHGRICRDSQGRTFNQHEDSAPVVAGQTAPVHVTIFDPLQRTFTFVDPQQKTVQVNKLSDPEKATAAEPPQPSRELQQAKASAATETQSRKVEDLGQRDFDGIAARGTRVTTVTPPGMAGNELPLTQKNESWEAVDFQLTVLSISDDPESGQTIYRIKNVQLGEPDPAVFQAPADYKLRESARW